MLRAVHLVLSIRYQLLMTVKNEQINVLLKDMGVFSAQFINSQVLLHILELRRQVLALSDVLD